MPRRHWFDLPLALRSTVAHQAGRVEQVEPVAAGSVRDFAAILRTSAGPLFCKGIETANPLARTLRNEARLNPHLPDCVPRLCWQVEEGGWLLLAFDHVEGVHADLSVGSTHLPMVADTLTALTTALTPCPVAPIQAAEVRWAGRIPPELIRGDTLIHTDVTPRNFLIGPRVWVVDWSVPCRGAAWIDTAFMVIRLIRAGHPPAQAEAWASTVPAWTTAPGAALDGFTQAIADLYQERLVQQPAPHRGPLADAAAQWAEHRGANLDPADSRQGMNRPPHGWAMRSPESGERVGLAQR